ncbi:MFS transporter [Glycomyces sp. L485]|uniref:MFS transporter n=1 Tax=Glycomyces sp. L485 TaxID=2909235 RepID=UPI001F4AB1A2|nr:MFS transporter [Glycomyces sp. L485]MCH7232156.1 MFS transporter [Glycomyces sp. L485]
MTTANRRTGLRSNRNFRLLWTGQAISIVGDLIFDVTVVLWVGTVVAGGESWAPTAVSAVLIAAAAPILVVGPLAGVFVDRWNRRTIMIWANLAQAILSFAMLAVAVTGGDLPAVTQLSAICFLVFLSNSAAQFFNPARFAVIGQAVPESDRPRAFGLFSATSNTAAILAPPLAAPILFASGVEWALGINAVSFLVSALCVWAVRLRPAEPAERTPHQGFWNELKEGFAFFVTMRPLVILILGTCVYMFGIGALNVLEVFFVTDNLATNASWLGTITAAAGAGTIVGALLTGRVSGRLGEAKVFSWGLVAIGLLVLLYSRQTALIPALVVLMLAAVPLGMVSTILGPLVLKIVPDHLLGRVNSIMNPLTYTTSITAMAVTGVLAGTVLADFDTTVAGVRFTTVDTVYGVAALFMIAAGAVVFRPLRNALKKAPEGGQDAPAVSDSGAERV